MKVVDFFFASISESYEIEIDIFDSNDDKTVELIMNLYLFDDCLLK